jgi:hypothetical protein
MKRFWKFKPIYEIVAVFSGEGAASRIPPRVLTRGRSYIDLVEDHTHIHPLSGMEADLPVFLRSISRVLPESWIANSPLSIFSAAVPCFLRLTLMTESRACHISIKSYENLVIRNVPPPSGQTRDEKGYTSQARQ